MTEFHPNQPPHAPDPQPIDEGGLRAPPGLTGWRKAWWWFDFIILVKLARLRFIAILVIIGVVITQWDVLTAYYDKWARPTVATADGGGDVEWFCPMHPSVIRDNAKEKCPICFMPLSKRKKGDVHEAALPAGVVNRVQLSPYRVVLAGVQTVEVDYRQVSKEIKAAGFIEFNERGLKSVSSRIAGRIDKLFVSETGQMVQAGDELASIYSPDLVVTVQNLLEARRANNPKNLESAQRRLELLGIDDAQIEEILRANNGRTDLTIRSPISGHVIKKYVREGQYVEPGSPLYDVADLATVWIQAQVYEDDMRFLPLDPQHPDRPSASNPIAITATTRAFPDEVFHGKLNFVFPHVDPNTRTVTIRCEIDNLGHKLRPGSTATVVLRVDPKNVAALTSIGSGQSEDAQMIGEGRALVVPESAVIDTGEQTIVYRETLPGTFEGVRVKLGPRMVGSNGEALFPLLDGLARGERIVATGCFLVDAETRLNPAAGSVYFGGSGGSKSAQAGSTVRPSTPEDESAKLAAALARLSPDDRKQAEAQRYCPILDSRLGSMGPPVKVTIEGRMVFLCYDSCKKSALANPQGTLAKVDRLMRGEDVRGEAGTGPQASKDEAEAAAEVAKLSPADRQLATEQKYCAVLGDSLLGSMGTPVKLLIEGHAVFLCCEGCRGKALANPKATLANAARLKQSHSGPAAGKIQP